MDRTDSDPAQFQAPTTHKFEQYLHSHHHNGRSTYLLPPLALLHPPHLPPPLLQPPSPTTKPSQNPTTAPDPPLSPHRRPPPPLKATPPPLPRPPRRPPRPYPPLPLRLPPHPRCLLRFPRPPLLHRQRRRLRQPPPPPCRRDPRIQLHHPRVGPLWRNLRRISTLQLFSSLRVAEFAPVRSHQVRALVENLNLLHDEGFGRVEVKPRLFDLTYGVMMGMIGAEGEDDVRGCRETVEEVFRVSGATNLGDFVGVVRWLGFGGLERKLGKLRKKRDECLGRMIERRRRKGVVEEERRSVIDVMLELQENEPEYYTDDIIKGMIVV